MGREVVGVMGYLLLEVSDALGQAIDRRTGSNTVLDAGRRALARLLAGEAQGPVFAVALGAGEAATSGGMSELEQPGQLQPVLVRRVETQENLVVLQTSFPPAPAEEVIAEAGLLISFDSDTTEPALYNRVRIEPALVLKPGETLRTTWELSFSPLPDGEEG